MPAKGKKTAKRPKAPVRRARGKSPAKSRKPRKQSAAALLKDTARVVSVFGAFGHRTLLELPTKVAHQVLGELDLAKLGPQDVVAAVEGELEELRKRDAESAESALAATALAMAHEIVNPFNSAHSKSLCAKTMVDALERLRELAPPEEKKDRVDELNSSREQRIAKRKSAT